MLVAKLDFLQYIAVRSFSNNVGARIKTFWRSKLTGKEGSHEEHGDHKPKQDVIKKDKKKVEPIDGRMPNASGMCPDWRLKCHRVESVEPMQSSLTFL